MLVARVGKASHFPSEAGQQHPFSRLGDFGLGKKYRMRPARNFFDNATLDRGHQWDAGFRLPLWKGFPRVSTHHDCCSPD